MKKLLLVGVLVLLVCGSVSAHGYGGHYGGHFGGSYRSFGFSSFGYGYRYAPSYFSRSVIIDPGYVASYSPSYYVQPYYVPQYVPQQIPQYVPVPVPTPDLAPALVPAADPGPLPAQELSYRLDSTTLEYLTTLAPAERLIFLERTYGSRFGERLFTHHFGALSNRVRFAARSLRNLPHHTPHHTGGHHLPHVPGNSRNPRVPGVPGRGR